jgi:hypothetical protein
MRQSLEQFNETKTALRAFAPLALAVGQQLLGLLQWNSALPGQREQARSLFEDAARTVPYSADARNLEIASRLFLAYQQPGAVASAPAILNDLQSAVALAPQNAQAASNLASFLELVSADATRTNRRLQVALTPADLRQQLAILRQVRTAGATSNPQ